MLPSYDLLQDDIFALFDGNNKIIDYDMDSHDSVGKGEKVETIFSVGSMNAQPKTIRVYMKPKRFAVFQGNKFEIRYTIGGAVYNMEIERQLLGSTYDVNMEYSGNDNITNLDLVAKDVKTDMDIIQVQYMNVRPKMYHRRQVYNELSTEIEAFSIYSFGGNTFSNNTDTCSILYNYRSNISIWVYKTVFNRLLSTNGFFR